MGDFKTAFIEGFGKSLAYAVGGIIFLLMVALLSGTGWLVKNKTPVGDFLKPKQPQQSFGN